MRRFIPDTLAGQVILVLLVGLLAFHLGSLWVHQTGSEMLLGSEQEHAARSRAAAAARVIATLPPDARQPAAAALSSLDFELRWLEPGRPAGDTSGSARGDDRLLLSGTEALPDGSSLHYRANPHAPGAEHATLLSTTAMALGILALGLIVVRIISRPLRALSDAADHIGRPGRTVTVAEEGPREVRHAAQAFNRMQARLDRIVADRTEALAAVSHDLRTPLARLRLRAGFIDDAEVQRQIDADLDEMDAMIASTLAFLRGDEVQEESRQADLAAMLQTLCNDAEDAGRTAVYSGPPQARLHCRPVTLKRAFANLVENAINYGKVARVFAEETDGKLVIRVEDTGPGVPEAELEAVFAPFYRLDRSRNRGTGGSGLGLAIARQAVEQHGGSVTLANLPEGGLRATVVLPRTPAAREAMTMVGRRAAITGLAAMAAGGTAGAQPLTVEVWRDPNCGCCSGWVEHLRAQGFAVRDRVVAAVGPYRAILGTPSELLSCHAGRVAGYALEGHVPAAAIRRLLAERPGDIAGLAVPGMPIGAPGMEVPGQPPERFDVIAFAAGGASRPWMRFLGADPTSEPPAHHR